MSPFTYVICFNGSKTKYDVIVIGGGHNGQTNAAYLTREPAKESWSTDRREARKRTWYKFALDSLIEMR